MIGPIGSPIGEQRFSALRSSKRSETVSLSACSFTVADQQLGDALRCANATPHVAQNTSNRSSAIDGRTTCHEGYAISQCMRKRIKEGFGWAKTIGSMRMSRFVGCAKLDFHFVLTFAAYKLVRMRNLEVAACC